MGNRATPTKLKVLTGNPGKRPINENEPEPERGVPKIPIWLYEFPVAVEEWKRESAILDSIGVMTIADGAALATRCYLASEIQGLAHDLKTEGRVVEGKANPKAIQIKNLLTEYRQLGSLLGMDPTSRTKLSTSSKGEGKFAGLIGGKK